MRKEAKSLTVRPILYIMRHIWNLDEKKVRELFTISEGLSAEDRRFLVDRSVDYIRRFDPNFSWKIVKQVDQTIKEEEGRVMPPLQISLDEAKQEGWKLGGIKKGRQEVALNLLSAGLDLEIVSKCTGLSKEEIKKLKNDS